MRKAATKTHLIKRLVILFIITTVVLMSGVIMAQRKTPQKFYYWAEATIVTRSFKLKSNIADINNAKPFLSGQNFGVIMGSKRIHAKVRQGYYKTEESATQKFKMIETEGVVNLYPFQFATKKFRYFEPYFLIGANRSGIKFFGNYVSTEQKTAGTVPGANVDSKTGTSLGTAEGTLICCCTDDGEMPTNPYQIVSIQSTPVTNPTAIESAIANDLTAVQQETLIDETTTESFLGKVMTTRATVGFGLECHVPGANHFINLFAELKYGFALNTTSRTAAFQDTKSSGQLSVNFGLSFGLSR